MGYKVTASKAPGAITAYGETAEGALERIADLEAQGYTIGIIRDDNGGSQVTKAQLRQRKAQDDAEGS